MYTYVHIYTYIYAYVYMFTHAYTYIHVHTYVACIAGEWLSLPHAHNKKKQAHKEPHTRNHICFMCCLVCVWHACVVECLCTSVPIDWHHALQHTSARCYTLHHTATHCNTLQHISALCICVAVCCSVSVTGIMYRA